MHDMLERRTAAFGASVLVSSLGTGLFLAASPVYLRVNLGIPAGLIATALGIGAAAGFAMATPIGRLADRYGPARVMVAINIWRCAGYLAYLLVHDFASFAVVAVLLLAVDRPAFAIGQAAVSEIFPHEKRSRVMALFRTASNAGFLLGIAVAGILLAQPEPAMVRIAIAMNAVSYLPAALFYWRVQRSSAARSNASPQRFSLRKVAAGPAGSSLLTMTASNIVLTMHDAILLTALPLWAIDRTSAPVWSQSAVLGVNAVIATLAQMPAARWLSSPEHSVRGLRYAGWLFVGATTCFAISAVPANQWVALMTLLVGAAFLSAVEVIHLAAFTEVTYALAPEPYHASYLSFFNLSVNAHDVVAPPVLTLVTQVFGPVGWMAVAAAYLSAATVGARSATRALALVSPGDESSDVGRELEPSLRTRATGGLLEEEYL